MAVKITDIEISCDPILDEAILSDVNQEVGFLGEEQKDFLGISLREVCSLCEGNGVTWDDNPLLPEIKKCNHCDGSGLVESSVPMVGNEECYYCKDHDE